VAGTTAVTRRLRAAAAALLLASALIAGCGGSDKEGKFKDGFKRVNAELVTLGQDVGTAVNGARGTPDVELARQFNRFAARLRAIKGRIAKLDPSDKLKSKRDALSSAVDKLIVDLQAIGTAASSHKPDAARLAATALVRDSQPAAEARRALARETGAKPNP
jgi:outer membrane murein-binding lipoprotein Lpp